MYTIYIYVALGLSYLAYKQSPELEEEMHPVIIAIAQGMIALFLPVVIVMCAQPFILSYWTSLKHRIKRVVEQTKDREEDTWR